MKEQLQAAFEAVKRGNVEASAESIAALKKMSRTENGLFPLNSVDNEIFEAARWVYPVYAAYETSCNKKEGYPDIVAQMHTLDKKLNEDFTFEHVSCFMDMLIHVIDYMSPEIYEYYRELVDVFRATVHKAVECFTENGKLKAAGDSEKLFRSAVARACDTEVVLAEKYQALC